MAFAGARVVEMVTVVEYHGFGGRERVARILFHFQVVCSIYFILSLDPT